MRAIITDPLYKALNTLAEKKAAWQKVIVTCYAFSLSQPLTDGLVRLFAVYGRLESERAGGKRSQVGKTPTFYPQFTQGESKRSPLYDIRHRR